MYTPPSENTLMSQHNEFCRNHFMNAFIEDADPARRKASIYRKYELLLMRREGEYSLQSVDWRGKEIMRERSVRQQRGAAKGCTASSAICIG
jgi:hypothetical protein